MLSGWGRTFLSGYVSVVSRHNNFDNQSSTGSSIEYLIGISIVVSLRVDFWVFLIFSINFKDNDLPVPSYPCIVDDMNTLLLFNIGLT